MLRIFIGLLTACLAGLPIMASAKTLTLEPSSEWVLLYAEDSCRLVRTFGTDDEKVYLSLDQYAPSDAFKIRLVGKPVRAYRPQADITFQFAPAEQEQKQLGIRGTSADGDPALIFPRFIRITPPNKVEQALHPILFAPLRDARESAVTSLRFSRGLRTELVLQTGPVHEPLKALRKCLWDTVAEWGLDIETQKTLRKAARPTSTPAKWVVSSDYPRKLLNRGNQGLVHFRLMVDKTGAVESCHIQDSTRPEEFETAVCRALIRRAAFEPAQDAKGNNIKSFFNSSVRFMIGPS